MIYVFTSAAVNYLPKVRLLCDSLKKHHPESMIHLALSDKLPDWLDLDKEPFDSIIDINELPIPNVKAWIFQHSLVELSTGIKPFVLLKLLQEPDCEAVIYLDPDIVVFSRLDDLLNDFQNSSILLTPHQTKPEHSVEAIIDNEICSLKHGIYNLGFIGVKNDSEGIAFAKWWSERLLHFCQAALERGLFTDQKWIDFVPVFFDRVKIIKSSRFNVATWNLTTRKLTGDLERGFLVDGEPLAFYHFTGFDSGDHVIMAAKNAGNNQAVRSLIQWYKKSIQKDEVATETPWAFATFENGVRITQAHRIIYRMRKDLQNAYPDPFKVVESGQCYYNWFNWQAALEHPDLVDDTDHEINRGRKPTTRINWSRILCSVRRAMSDYRYGARICGQMITVLRTQGCSGLRRQLSKANLSD